MMRFACVAVVKDEAENIVEWIAYQLALGFNTVILYDNGSSDDTVARAKAFSSTFDVRVVNWCRSSADYQIQAYEHAVHELGHEFTWMAFFDTDEFLVLSDPFELDRLFALLTAGDTAAVAVPWAIFGSSGHVERPRGLVIEAFTRRAHWHFGPNRHVKSIVRPELTIGCQNPHLFRMNGPYRSLEGSSITLNDNGLVIGEPNYSMGKLHHYFTRSRAHWAAKLRRGYHDLKRLETDFENYDRNEVSDTAALRYLDPVNAIISQLDISALPPPPEPAGLVTEFGTLLCWNAAEQKLSHRPAEQMQGFHPLLWLAHGMQNQLFVEFDHKRVTIDATTGRPTSAHELASFQPVPSERAGDIGIRLDNGFFLSARIGEMPGGPGPVRADVGKMQAWESFTPMQGSALKVLMPPANDQAPRITLRGRETARIDGLLIPLHELLSFLATLPISK